MVENGGIKMQSNVCDTTLEEAEFVQAEWIRFAANAGGGFSQLLERGELC